MVGEILKRVKPVDFLKANFWTWVRFPPPPPLFLKTMKADKNEDLSKYTKIQRSRNTLII